MGSLNEVTHIVLTGEVEGQILNEVRNLASFFFRALSHKIPTPPLNQAIQIGLDGSSKMHSLMQESLKSSLEQKRKKRKLEES